MKTVCYGILSSTLKQLLFNDQVQSVTQEVSSAQRERGATDTCKGLS